MKSTSRGRGSAGSVFFVSFPSPRPRSYPSRPSSHFSPRRLPFSRRVFRPPRRFGGPFLREYSPRRCPLLAGILLLGHSGRRKRKLLRRNEKYASPAAIISPPCGVVGQPATGRLRLREEGSAFVDSSRGARPDACDRRGCAGPAP